VVFTARYQDRLDGLALIAPALAARVPTPPALLLGVLGSLPASPRRPFTIPLTPEQYTDTPRFRAFVADDPRRLPKATARLWFESARLDLLARRAAERIRLPVFLAQGERDAIVDLAGLRAWVERVPARDKVLCFYPEFAHILEFEDNRERYLADLLAWFRAQSSARHLAVAAAGRA
jgi:alpha-beta hydrolase superfamily lysophospholipase